jgi:hypothetical protein
MESMKTFHTLMGQDMSEYMNEKIGVDGVDGVEEQGERIVIGNNDVVLKIQNENEIQTYTEGTFMNRFIKDWQYNGETFIYDESHSPLCMSNENSEDETDDSEKHPKKWSYIEVQKSIDKQYESTEPYYNELDILTTYLKGQKNIFGKSRYVTQMKLNMLMIPALIGTAIISICAPILQEYVWSGVFISGLNTLVAFLISIIHYFKLEPLCELYLYLMNHYDRLESSVEFTNNRISFFDVLENKRQLIFDKMTDVEKKIGEIKETTKVILPNEIKVLFPVICNINIFSFIKRIESHKQNLMNKLKDVKNELEYIEWKKEKDNNKEKIERAYKRLDYLLQVKDKLKNEILHYKNAYVAIDELFVREIKRADNVNIFFVWCHKQNFKDSTNNHALQEYLSTIFITD